MVRRLPAKQHQVGSIPTGVSYGPEAGDYYFAIDT